MKIRIFLLAIVLIVPACAFRLMDNIDLPPQMESTYINYAGTDAQLLRTVARALTLNGSKVARRTEQATAILDVLSANVQQRVLLKDFAGRARESELIVTIRFRVRSAEGGVLMTNTTAQRRTTVVLEPTSPLSNQGEIASTAESLREEVVRDMLQLISTTPLQEIEREVEAPNTSEIEAGVAFEPADIDAGK